MRAVIIIIQGQGVMIKLILKVFVKWFHFFFLYALSLKIHLHFST